MEEVVLEPEVGDVAGLHVLGCAELAKQSIIPAAPDAVLFDWLAAVGAVELVCLEVGLRYGVHPRSFSEHDREQKRQDRP